MVQFIQTKTTAFHSPLKFKKIAKYNQRPLRQKKKSSYLLNWRSCWSLIVICTNFLQMFIFSKLCGHQIHTFKVLTIILIYLLFLFFRFSLRATLYNFSRNLPYQTYFTNCDNSRVLQNWKSVKKITSKQPLQWFHPTRIKKAKFRFGENRGGFSANSPWVEVW